MFPFQKLLSCLHFAVQLKYWIIYAFSSARLILGIFVAASFMKLQYAVRKHGGTSLALIATMMSISQFHFLFYATRTLPNIFALVLSEWNNIEFVIIVEMDLTVGNVLPDLSSEQLLECSSLPPKKKIHTLYAKQFSAFFVSWTNLTVSLLRWNEKNDS